MGCEGKRVLASVRRGLRLAALGAGVGALMCAFTVSAQRVSSSASTSYSRSVWRVSDGLPEDTVQALAQTTDGMLSIGTTGGLASFDGARIRTYGAGLAQSLGVNSIFCLEVARDGTLWAGTEGGGLLHLQGDVLQVFSGANGLGDGFVRSVFEDDRGQLWVGTDDGLFRMEGKRLSRVDTGETIAPLAVHSITEDREHRLWVGGARLIAIGQDGSSRTYTLRGAYSENRVKKILQTSDGTIWVGTVGGLQYLRGDRFETLPGIHATVRSLLQTSDGTLWIGTIGNGLWTLRNGRLMPMQSPGLLPSETVLSILEDRQGQIWIGTQAGLVRLNRTPVSLVQLPKASDPDFETISGDDRGNVWVAAQNLYMVRNGEARQITYPGLEGVSVRNVYRARDGALWIGTDGSGVYRVAQSTTHYSAPKELTNNFIRGFLESGDGDMWIATDEGVSCIGVHDARKFTEASGLVYFSTRSLLEDHAGAIWIGTDRGLSVWKDGGFQQNAATRALAREKIWSILEDRRGVLWFGTRDHGIFRDRDGVVQQYTTEQDLPTTSVYQLLQDRRGTFWLTGANTIASVGEAEMDGPPPTPEQPLSVAVYSMPFGADDAQLYGGREPAGFLAPDDTVWFPTSRGVAHVVAADPTPHGAPPRAVISEIAEDGRAAPLGGPIAVAAGVTRLSFRFSAIYLGPQTEVHLRYRLEGFDGAWSVAAPDQVASYTNLKAGRYRFRVKAFDSSNPTAVTEVSVVVTKTPVFYQTTWFYVLCAALLGGAAWTIYRLRLGQIRTRFHAVLEERNRLAREMHDTVIQGCTGISALLEAMAISSSGGDGGANAELLDYAREQARTTIDEARQAVWDMRHERGQGIELVEAIHGLAAQTAREHKEISVKVDAVGPLWLKASAVHEILMTVREAVYNASQHSGTERIDLRVRSSGDELLVAVEDYGCGLPEERMECSREGHYGILGMRERMKRLGGSLDLTTRAGQGTTVTLELAGLSTLEATERS